MVAYVSVLVSCGDNQITVLIHRAASTFITIPYCVTVTHCAIIEIRNIIIGNANNILLLCIIFCDLLLGSAVPINIDISVRSRESCRLNEFRRFCAPRLKFVELKLFSYYYLETDSSMILKLMNY